MTPAPKILSMSFSSDDYHNDHVIGAYYPSWKIYKGSKPSDLRIKRLTHVYYAFARMQDDGTVISLDVKADLQYPIDGMTGCVAALQKHRQEQNPKCKLVLSIGGGSGSSQYPKIAASQSRRKRFSETARQMVDQYGFDGIDIDWEHPDTSEKGTNFGLLMTALRVHFPSPKYIIIAALPAGEWCLRNIDLRALLDDSPPKGAVMDFVNIMAYDFAGPWTNGQSGHQASLHSITNPHNDFAKRSISSVTRYLVKDLGIDPKRAIIGIPVYGRSFVGVGGPGEKFTCVGGDSDGTVEYKSLPRPGTAEIVDAAVGAASCHAGAEGWISYDNPETVRMKAEFVKANRLGGIFFWTGSFDSADEKRSLIQAGYSVLGSTT